MRRGALVIGIVALLGLCALWRPPEPAPKPSRDSDFRRVVSLAPSFTEVLSYLGAADRLAGVTVYCEGVDPAVARVGTFRDPNVERILELDPDLVLAIAGQEQAPVVRGLRERHGLRVEVLGGDTIADLEQTLRQLGEWVGARERASEFLARLASVLAVPPPPGDSPRVLFVVDHNPLYVAGGGSFLEPMLHAAGFRNLFGERAEAWIQVDLEEIHAREPDCIIDVVLSDPERSRSAPWPRLAGQLRAVAQGRVYPFPEVRCGVRIPDWVERLRALRQKL